MMYIMKISDFTYDLPDELIAKHPPRVRGTSRLLVLDRQTNHIFDQKYVDILDLLNPGDLLVLNDTKVIKSRIMTTKTNGAKRELILLERHGSDTNWHRHQALHRGSLKSGDILTVHVPDSSKNPPIIVVDEVLGGGISIVSSSTDLLKLADRCGTPPLPPYMRRQASQADIERYQTIFANKIGSAAAPTASLNMTSELMSKLEKKGVIIKYLTLHVGLGTFLPIRADNVEDHHMHSEYYEIPDDTIAAVKSVKRSGRRVVALGTTVARTLECYAHTNKTAGEADIFIYPGYHFDLVDALLTNFHAPNSTVLMLASAFAGWENLQLAYTLAVAKKYQFLSYGDSMFIS